MRRDVRTLAVLILAAALCAGAGCSSAPVVEIQRPEGFYLVPAGRTAVLRVKARPLTEELSYKFLWGVVQAPTAEASFADLLAHHARVEGGMNVIPPAEVEERLRLAGLEPTLEPDDEQLQAFAKMLGVSSYLTANVEQWRYRYVFFSEKASIRFSVACRAPGEDKPLWSARAHHKASGDTERAVAGQALRAMFRILNWQPEK